MREEDDLVALCDLRDDYALGARAGAPDEQDLRLLRETFQPMSAPCLACRRYPRRRVRVAVR